MSLTSGLVGEGEQAVEKIGDHIVDRLRGLFNEFMAKVWRTRITLTVDISERPNDTK